MGQLVTEFMLVEAVDHGPTIFGEYVPLRHLISYFPGLIMH